MLQLVVQEEDRRAMQRGDLENLSFFNSDDVFHRGKISYNNRLRLLFIEQFSGYKVLFTGENFKLFSKAFLKLSNVSAMPTAFQKFLKFYVRCKECKQNFELWSQISKIFPSMYQVIFDEIKD